MKILLPLVVWMLLFTNAVSSMCTFFHKICGQSSDLLLRIRLTLPFTLSNSENNVVQLHFQCYRYIHNHLEKI